MIISFDGTQDEKQMEASLIEILKLFRERYHVSHYREIHLNVTLVDEDGCDVELVDEETNTPFRHFKVCMQHSLQKKSSSEVRLVVDNTKPLKL